MRRLLTLTLGVIGAGCADATVPVGEPAPADESGVYVLRRVGSAAVPTAWVVGPTDTTVLLADTLVLQRPDRVTQRVVLQLRGPNGGPPDASGVAVGSYGRRGDSVTIQFAHQGARAAVLQRSGGRVTLRYPFPGSVEIWEHERVAP